MKYHHYRDTDGSLIRIITKYTKPNKHYARGIWIVLEWSKEDGWHMPSFPEITWGRLKRLEYLGSVKAEERT